MNELPRPPAAKRRASRSRAFLRAIVIRTAAWPGLRTMYRWYYLLAARAFVAVLRRSTDVQRILSVRSFAAGTWVPGHSDIDLFVIIRSMPPAVELPRLRSLWRTIARLRIAFPILGTVHIMSDSELNLWKSAGGPRRLECSTWRSLLDAGD